MDFYSIFSDWHFLSHCNYLVGTHSSQVTRVAYELMQLHQVDASKQIKSLDHPWYFPILNYERYGTIQ